MNKVFSKQNSSNIKKSSSSWDTTSLINLDENPVISSISSNILSYINWSLRGELSENVDEDRDFASRFMVWLTRRFEEVGVEVELVDFSHSDARVGVVWLVSWSPLPIILDIALWLILFPNRLATLFNNRADGDPEDFFLFDFLWSSSTWSTLLLSGGDSG